MPTDFVTDKRVKIWTDRGAQSRRLVAILRRSDSPSPSQFLILDYEVGPIPGEFDAAVIYAALHHAEIEYLVTKNVYDALVPGGVLITIEPGRGHSHRPIVLKLSPNTAQPKKTCRTASKKSIWHALVSLKSSSTRAPWRMAPLLAIS
jgi:SAM-dependent methyltransferase